MLGWSNANCFALRRDEKGAAMYEFCRRQRRIPRARPAGKIRQDFYRKANFPPLPKKFSPLAGLNFFKRWSDTNCLVSRQDSKPAALFLFEGVSPKGKNREGGPGQNSRQEIYTGRIPSVCFLIKKAFLSRCNKSILICVIIITSAVRGEYHEQNNDFILSFCLLFKRL